MRIHQEIYNVRICRVGSGFAVFRGPVLVGTRRTFNEAYFFAREAA